MNPHLILKSFEGSQDGLSVESFIKDTTRHLSADLARIAVSEGWAEEVSEAAYLEGALGKIEGVDVPEADLKEALANPADLRETKVDAPEETKPAKPAAKKGKK